MPEPSRPFKAVLLMLLPRPPRRTQNISTLMMPHPKGPCAQIVYTLAPKYKKNYFKAKVYSIWPAPAQPQNPNALDSIKLLTLPPNSVNPINLQILSPPIAPI